MAFRIALPAIVAGTMLLASCGSPPQYPAVKAEAGPIATAMTFAASVNPRWNVSIVPNAAGKVVSLNVTLGQSVNQGDVIAELDKRSLQDAVTQAEADVATARAKLNSVQSGARSEDVAAAQAEVAAAQAAVADLSQGRPEAIAQAQATADAAQQKLAAARTGGRPESIQQAQAKLDADQAALLKLQSGPQPEDVTNARLAIEQAKDNLYTAQINRDALCAGVRTGQTAATGAPVNCQAGQAAVLAGQTAVDQANTGLAKLTAPPRAEDLVQARAVITADQQALALARQPNRPEDIAQLEAAVSGAQAQLDQARKPGSAAAIAQAQQKANAQKALAAKTANPYTPQDVTQAQAGVQSADAALQTARTALNNGTIVAPAKGTISEVSVAVGSLASPTSPVAAEVAAELEVASEAGQDQVGRLSSGQPAVILAGCDRIPAHISAIAPTADPKTRTYTVKVEPNTASPALRAGMSVTVQIGTGRVDSAVAVPASAVQTRNGQQVVFKAVEGKARMTPVQSGLITATQVQLTSGVQPGELILLPGSSKLSDGDPVSPAIAEPSGAPGSPSSASAPAPACDGVA